MCVPNSLCVQGHFFYILCVLGVSGNDLPCRSADVDSNRNSRTFAKSSSKGSSRESSSASKNDSRPQSTDGKVSANLASKNEEIGKTVCSELPTRTFSTQHNYLYL
jgi:hypothetical protein